MATLFCEKCGTPIPENGTFCQNCGTPCAASTPPMNTGYIPYQAPQTPPIPQMPVYANTVTGKSGKGLGWITFLRTILWFFFGVIVLSTLGATIMMMDEGGEPLAAIAILLSGVLVAFLTVAAGMVALNNATNLRSIASNTAKTVELLQDLYNKK